MGAWQAALLGLVQGVTEFLPVSSSGHLVVAEQALGLKTGGDVFFEVVLHTGTLLAVIAVYAKDLWRITGPTLRALSLLARGRPREATASPDARLGLFLILGTIPTGIIGVTLKDLFESLFANLLAVGVAFLLTGTLLFLSTRIAARRSAPPRETGAMRWSDAVLIGTAQGIAITPGISRSGSTIAAALLLGLDRSLAARYSFLLSVPAILGALVLHLRHGLDPLSAADAGAFVTGFVAAALSGILALRVLLRLVDRGRFSVFAYYLWPLGLTVLVWALVAP